MVLPMGASRVARIALHAPSGPELAANLGTAGRDPQRVTPHLRTLRRPLGKREPQLAAFLGQSSESPTARTSSTAVPTGLLGQKPQCQPLATLASRQLDFVCPQSWTVH